MKLNGYICIYLYALYTNTISSSLSTGSGGKQKLEIPDSQNNANFPRFAEPIPNITVTVGRDALLACVVDNLKGYKVAWVRVDTQTILSIHHNVITQNPRIILTHNDHRSWYLHIREVEESDRGWYMCQVNTDPMRSRKGYLQVVVPPVIIESLTSNDLVVREGTNVTLQCRAKGFPEPYVMWRREDGNEMSINGENVNVVDGEILSVTKVSRLHMAAYLCVASNGVPPSISRRVMLKVQFPPMLSIPNQLEGAYVGQDVILECHTEAYPASINYWTTERGDMIISDTSRAGDKYETISTNSGYSKFMKLKIRNVGPNDFGFYRCVAKNSLGETDGMIKLDEIAAPTTTLTTELTFLSKIKNRIIKKPNQAIVDYTDEWRNGENDYNGDYMQSSRSPPSIRHPPGAFHNTAIASRVLTAVTNRNEIFIRLISLISCTLFIQFYFMRFMTSVTVNR
ncbi:lachesin isoform X2 [Chironomus tepperi]|uniref:lachesin isoform X2 n=1 Tax=Chironomus tepperi TaxID=113505 RepID=UPI00391F122C